MTQPFDPKRVTLEGRHVRLEPLARRHAEDLFEVGQDETIWPYMPRPPLKSVEDTRARSSRLTSWEALNMLGRSAFPRRVSDARLIPQRASEAAVRP